jgi:hypothetical protein
MTSATPSKKPSLRHILRERHIREAPSLGDLVLDHSPGARSVWAYAELAKEVIDRE